MKSSNLLIILPAVQAAFYLHFHAPDYAMNTMRVEGKNVTDGESVVMTRPNNKYPSFGGGGCIDAEGLMRQGECVLSPIFWEVATVETTKNETRTMKITTPEYDLDVSHALGARFD
jgi:hypothetical protein